MVESFFAFIFLVPIYALLIWTYFHPAESMLFGKRWMYQEEPEFSESAIGYLRFVSVIAMFFVTIGFVSYAFESYAIRLVFILGLFVYIIYGFLKLRKKVTKL